MTFDNLIVTASSDAFPVTFAAREMSPGVPCLKKEEEEKIRQHTLNKEKNPTARLYTKSKLSVSARERKSKGNGGVKGEARRTLSK